MKEEQVEVEILAVDGETHLASYEREAHPELQEEVAHVLDEPVFEVRAPALGAEQEEVEDVGVLERLLREVGSAARAVSP
jgi:hypothetical protein